MKIRITTNFSFMKFDPKEKERGTSQRGRFSSPSLLLSLRGGKALSMLVDSEKRRKDKMTLRCFRGAENKWFQEYSWRYYSSLPRITVSSFWGWKSAKGTDTVGKGLGNMVCNPQLCLFSRRHSWILRVNMVEVGCRLWNKAEKLRENSHLLLNENQKHLAQCRFGEEIQTWNQISAHILLYTC